MTTIVQYATRRSIHPSTGLGLLSSMRNSAGSRVSAEVDAGRWLMRPPGQTGIRRIVFRDYRYPGLYHRRDDVMLTGLGASWAFR